ncbi:MAG: DUF4399 domain-containing protein [Bdellovibrionales bacterium]|nr:DUF4399 domain-containing protein [Bdellovibrionales bacterium]
MRTVRKCPSLTCALLGLLFCAANLVQAAEFRSQPAPKDAEAYIISPADGETVPENFTVQFGLRNFGIAPAGEGNEKTGHHHLLIDFEGIPALDTPLPATDNIRHFGGGQTETTLSLSPGKHTLQLVLGDKLHIPHNPPIMSKKITITVKE